MQVGIPRLNIATSASIAVSVAMLAKTFVPFYLIGSNVIFVLSVLSGSVLIGIGWRKFIEAAPRVRGVLILIAVFYAAVVLSFLLYSRGAVPATHLLGIAIFHGIFLVFGFSAALCLRPTLIVLTVSAAIYAAVILLHALRFGRIMAGINIDDVFGIGDPAIYVTFHQNIGLVLSMGALAVLGLAPNRLTKILAIGAVPFLMLLLFHVAARTALVALAASLIFLGFNLLWAYSRRVAALSAAAVIATIVIVGATFPERRLSELAVDPIAPDAVSRTLRELQDPRPGLRIQIWEQTWNKIISEPSQLLLGRGTGMYPVEAGFGAPNWLLRPTEGSKHYPHNVHLEVLYENGVLGLLLFSILTALPIFLPFYHRGTYSSSQNSAASIYVFILVSSAISGSFAYTYALQFFLGLNVGIAASKTG